MFKKLTLLAMLAVMVFGVAVLAGCGGDDEKAGSGDVKDAQAAP